MAASALKEPTTMETLAGILEKIRSERDPKQAVTLLMQSIGTMVRDEISKRVVEIIDANNDAYVQAVFESPDQPGQPQQAAPQQDRRPENPQPGAPRAAQPQQPGRPTGPTPQQQPKDDKNA